MQKDVLVLENMALRLRDWYYKIPLLNKVQRPSAANKFDFSFGNDLYNLAKAIIMTYRRTGVLISP